MADLASRQRSFRLAVVVIATAGMASWLSPTPVRGQKHDSEARAAGPATDPQARVEKGVEKGVRNLFRVSSVAREAGLLFPGPAV